MSLPHIPDPMPGDAAAADAIETVIVPRARDLGGFEVRRALPSAQRSTTVTVWVRRSPSRRANSTG